MSSKCLSVDIPEKNCVKRNICLQLPHSLTSRVAKYASLRKFSPESFFFRAVFTLYVCVSPAARGLRWQERGGLKPSTSTPIWQWHDHADDAIYLTTGRENAYLLNLARLPDPHPIAIRLGLDWLLGAVHKWIHHIWGVSVNFLPPITFTQKWCKELIPPSPDVTCYFWADHPPPPSSSPILLNWWRHLWTTDVPSLIFFVS